MEHHFSVEIAREYGMLEAVLLNNLAFWIEKNAANKRNFHDGSYWTYNSVRAFSELFPYASGRKIMNALKRLEDEGIIKTGNFNADARDRSIWYTLTEKGNALCKNVKCIMQNSKMHSTESQNALCKNVTPLPDINADSLPDIETHISQESGAKRDTFNKPTIEEVRQYCEERQNGINAQDFIDFYDSKGWMIGKNKMKDWKAAVRTWENKRKAEGTVGINGIKLKPDTGEPDILDGIL